MGETPNIEVVFKGSEIRVDGVTYISRKKLEDHPLYTTRGLDDLVANGTIRTYFAHGKTYYAQDDLDRLYAPRS